MNSGQGGAGIGVPVQCYMECNKHMQHPLALDKNRFKYANDNTLAYASPTHVFCERGTKLTSFLFLEQCLSMVGV